MIFTIFPNSNNKLWKEMSWVPSRVVPVALFSLCLLSLCIAGNVKPAAKKGKGGYGHLVENLACKTEDLTCKTRPYHFRVELK